MKKVKMIILTIFSFMCLTTSVNAYQASSGMDLSTCLAFADVFRTITRSEGSYEYKYCYRAMCNNKRTALDNRVYNSGYRCQNGNATPYTQVKSDGCPKQNSACSNTNGIFCTKVTFVDCTKNKDGSAYKDNVVTTKVTTKATTKKVTTKATTTTKKKTTTTKKTTTRYTGQETTFPTIKATTKAPVIVTTSTTTTTTTTTTTKAIDPSNTKVKSIVIGDYKLKNYTNDLNTYELSFPYGITDAEVKLELEDPEAKYSVTGNTDMPDDTTTINIVVTARDKKTTRNIAIEITRYYLKSADCSLKNIYIEDYELEFNSNTTEYKLSLDKEVNSLDIEVLPSDDKNKGIEIIGNEKLKNNSIIKINVTAEDDTKCTYQIKIKKSSGLLKYVLIFIGLFGILGVSVYFLLKYLRKSKGRYKYE